MASYAQVTPSFSTCYGTNPALGNTDIVNGIAGGVGLVAYMGHGAPDAWLHWSYSSASFMQSDASALTNGALTPVVWSIACQTGDPRQGEIVVFGPCVMKGYHERPEDDAAAADLVECRRHPGE